MAYRNPFTFKFLEDFGVPLRPIRLGEYVFKKGEAGDKMFLVLAGKVDAVVGDKVIASFGLHDIFGEMALLDLEPRSATAIVKEAGEVAVIDRSTFLDLVREQPSFALYVMRTLAKRLRSMNNAP